MKFIDPNIARKGRLINSHLAEQNNGETFPLFSLIEFNLSGLCTRRCVFCPRSDAKKFPNVNEHMPLKLYEKIMADLQKANFDGTILYSAFSEPLLYEHLDEIIKVSRRYCPKARVEIVNNGDLVTPERISRLFKAGLTTLCISMYDGPEQEEYFKKIQKDLALRDDQLFLRKRWLPAKENFGITLSNRAGAIEIKETGTFSLKEPMKSACYYPFYQAFVDYTGEVLLCPHDWGKKLILGNVKDQSILEIWDNKIFKKMRIKLSKKDRNFLPCDKCDVKGILMGQLHFDKWLQYYAKQQPTGK